MQLAGIHDMQLACMHDASLADRYHSNLFQALSRDSGEDMKECGRGQSERHEKSWGGGGRKKEKGRALPLPSFLPIFLFLFFVVLFCFIFFHVRAFSIQRTLLSRSLEHTKAEEGLPTSDFRSRGVANLTHGTHVRTWKSRAQKRYKMNN